MNQLLEHSHISQEAQEATNQREAMALQAMQVSADWRRRHGLRREGATSNQARGLRGARQEVTVLQCGRGACRTRRGRHLRCHKFMSTCGRALTILSSVRQKIVSSQRKKSLPIFGRSQITNYKFATATHECK